MSRPETSEARAIPGNGAATPTLRPAARSIRVEGGKGWGTRLSEIWNYRETMGFLAWREIKVRYRQTIFGTTWAIVQPLGMMLVFVVFASILHLKPKGSIPYPLFAFTALVPWTYLSQSVTLGASSVVRDATLVSKVYFPRLIMPLGVALALLLDLAVGLGAVALMMIYYGAYPPSALPLLALGWFVFLLLATGLGAGTLFAGLNVIYRDVRVAVPFLVQIWLFASPIAYSSTLVPERWELVYALNPMVSVVDGFRWVLLGSDAPSLATVGVSTASALLLLLSALVYFRQAERRFADVI